MNVTIRAKCVRSAACGVRRAMCKTGILKSSHSALRTPHSALFRTAFTLIELLVSIAIIGILLALLVPVVMQVIGRGTVLLTTNEMSALDNSIQLFKTTYGVGHVPSQVRLCEQFGQYVIRENGANPEDPLDRASVDFLLRVWPKLLSPDVNGKVPWATTGIDWNANGTIDPPMTLEGHQCLVFFLGGAQQRSPVFACLGFATDARDPIKLSQSQGRKGPFFEFPTTRLGIWPGNQAGSTGLYFSFFDPYSQNSPPQAAGNPGDKPYAYFSNFDQRNGYNDFSQPPGSPNRKLPTADCASLGINPYWQPGATGPQYYNANSHQIISAGLDRKHGKGGQWLIQTSNQIDANGRDDQSNFTAGALMSVAQ
jgi:prepilin-type N-terminal cleavage/methylation domain-containing protein